MLFLFSEALSVGASSALTGMPSEISETGGLTSKIDDVLPPKTDAGLLSNIDDGLLYSSNIGGLLEEGGNLFEAGERSLLGVLELEPGLPSVISDLTKRSRTLPTVGSAASGVSPVR